MWTDFFFSEPIIDIIINMIIINIIIDMIMDYHHRLSYRLQEEYQEEYKYMNFLITRSFIFGIYLNLSLRFFDFHSIHDIFPLFTIIFFDLFNIFYPFGYDFIHSFIYSNHKREGEFIYIIILKSS